jgi:hypothetical protein
VKLIGANFLDPQPIRPTAEQTAELGYLTPSSPAPRKRVRCVPGMLNSSEVKFLYPT